LLQTKPEFVVERAIKKMLPATRLGAAIFKNLHVIAGAKHEHEAQQPKAISLKTVLEKKSK
jgi:large subunit ribosomal protein L13